MIIRLPLSGAGAESVSGLSDPKCVQRHALAADDLNARTWTKAIVKRSDSRSLGYGLVANAIVSAELSGRMVAVDCERRPASCAR